MERPQPDGEHLWAIRYASPGLDPNTLYVSAEPATIRKRYPDRERLAHIPDDTRIVVSEPLADLPGAWHEIDPATALVIGKGRFEQRAFAPAVPAGGAAT